MIRARHRLRAGFTLIEVLIATSMLAVIGLAIAETLRAARDTDRRFQARTERRAQDHAIVARLSRDLRALMPPGGTYAAGLVGEQVDRQGGRELLSKASEESAADSGAASIAASAAPYAARDRITISVIPGARRFGTSWAAGTGAIQSVIWEIDDDATTVERGLVRRATAVRDPVTGAAVEPVEVVCAEACGLAFRYFDGTDWQETWDSSAQNLIPQAVEVSVAVRGTDGELRRLVAVVAPQAGRQSTLIEAKTE